MTDPAPYYDIHVFLCTNERPAGHPRGSCAARGSVKLKDYMKARAKELGLVQDGRVRVQQAGCLERCEVGPCLVIYPEGVWYAPRTREDIDEILTVHVRDGGRVARLMLDPQETEREQLEERGLA